MRALRVIAPAVVLGAVVLFLAANKVCHSHKPPAEPARVAQNQPPLPGLSEPNVAAAKPGVPPGARGMPDVNGMTAPELEELSADVLTSIRPVTWKKPSYSGATQLSEEDQKKVIRLVERYEENFQKIKKLAFHEETTTLPVGDSQWTRENVMTPGGGFAESPTSIDITAARAPTFFQMKGQSQGRSLDLTVSALGEMGTQTQGESWRASYMDGYASAFNKSYLLQRAGAVHENIRCDMELPELGNLARQYHLSDTVFTVVELPVTDHWESLGDSYPSIPARETVWFNNRTGMPQIVVREITDETERRKLKHPYTRAQIIEYAEVGGVCYPRLMEWIGKGYQLRRTTRRTQVQMNGVAVE